MECNSTRLIEIKDVYMIVNWFKINYSSSDKFSYVWNYDFMYNHENIN